MITDYYAFFRIERYSDFNLTDQEIYERLESYFPTRNVTNLISKFETGVYVLSDPFIKARYDYILHIGWSAVLSNPMMLLYVLYILGIVRIRSFILYSKQSID